MSIKDKYTREEDKRFTLRIDKNIFEKIEEEARRNKRSVGRQIEFILEQHIKSVK